jgi:hypothetical protein
MDELKANIGLKSNDQLLAEAVQKPKPRRGRASGIL